MDALPHPKWLDLDTFPALSASRRLATSSGDGGGKLSLGVSPAMLLARVALLRHASDLFDAALPFVDAAAATTTTSPTTNHPVPCSRVLPMNSNDGRGGGGNGWRGAANTPPLDGMRRFMFADQKRRIGSRLLAWTSSLAPMGNGGSPYDSVDGGSGAWGGSGNGGGGSAGVGSDSGGMLGGLLYGVAGMGGGGGGRAGGLSAVSTIVHLAAGSSGGAANVAACSRDRRD
jgi:hypothetical protein